MRCCGLAILDLEAAHKLGYKLMRVQYMMNPAAFVPKCTICGKTRLFILITVQ